MMMEEEYRKIGNDRLTDVHGYTYNVHSRRKKTTYWQCTVRPRGAPCKAFVTERDRQYTKGQHGHNHAVGKVTLHFFSILKNIFYKNIEAEACEIYGSPR